MNPQKPIVAVIPLDQTCRTCLRKVDTLINIFEYLIQGKFIAETLNTCMSLQVCNNISSV